MPDIFIVVFTMANAPGVLIALIY